MGGNSAPPSPTSRETASARRASGGFVVPVSKLCAIASSLILRRCPWRQLCWGWLAALSRRSSKGGQNQHPAPSPVLQFYLPTISTLEIAGQHSVSKHAAAPQAA